MQQSALTRYVNGVIERGELYIEINRVQKLLVDLQTNPLADARSQRHNVESMTRIFQALLLAKEARQEIINHI